MHEMAVAQSIYQIVMDYAKEHNASRIDRIKLRIGKMTGIEVDCIRFYWETIGAGTVAEQAVIEADEIPVSARCTSCGKEFEAENSIPVCPFCGNFFCEITAGKELDVMSIEIED